jgi:hypothetical protein
MRLKALVLLVLAVSLAAPAVRGEDALTNQDVIKMVAAGLGDSLVIAKIREAAAVDFALEVDDLVKLRKAGVNETVVQAMLERKASAAWPAAPAAPVPAVGGNPENPWLSMQEDLGYELVKVALKTTEGTVMRIPILRGDISSVGFMGFGAVFVNYPGLRAQVRTHDKRPAILVKSMTPLTGGRYFITKLDVDEDDGIRSLKISSAKAGLKGVFGNTRGMIAPDPDWTLPFDSVEESPGIWRVTPKKDLNPGEYGWYVDLGAGGQAGGIFSFGVD